MLDYAYEIIEVNVQLNNMMVKFTSPGREDVYTGTTLPTEGVPLDEFIAPYAPIGYWMEQDRQKYIPEVGTTGEFKVADFLAKQEEELLKLRIENVESELNEQQIEELIAALKK